MTSLEFKRKGLRDESTRDTSPPHAARAACGAFKKKKKVVNMKELNRRVLLRAGAGKNKTI